MAKPILVTQSPDQDKFVPHEIIAAEILAISQGMRALRKGPLSDRALVLLIQNAAPPVDNCMITKQHVRAVLQGIDQLETEYLKVKK